MSRKRTSNRPALIQLSDNQIVPAVNYITESEYKIGRSPDSDLNLPLPYVSRKHCSFLYQPRSKHWCLVSHTKKGVSVRGNPITAEVPFKLECGDTIKISAILVFEFKCSPNEEGKCCSDCKKLKVSNTDSSENESTAVNISELPTVRVAQIPEPSDLEIASASSVNNLWTDDIASPVFQIADLPNSFEPIDNPNFSNDFQAIDMLSPPDFGRTEISPSKDWINTVPIVSTDPEIGSDPIISTEPIIANDSVTTTEYEEDIMHQSELLHHSDPETNMVDLEDQMYKYLNKAKKCRGSKKQSLNEELKYRLTYLKKLEELRSSCDLQCNNSDINSSIIDTLKHFSTFFKNEYSCLSYKNNSASKNQIDEQLIQIVLNMDFLLIEKTKSVMDLVLNLFNSLFNKFNTSSPLSQKTMCNIKEHDDFNQIQLEKNTMKLEIEKQKETIKWYETRISFLERKLKEKEGVEQKMESAMEESTRLENQVAELKRSLANMEIMELRYKCLLETSKHREADKRNKDALQKTIDDLNKEINELKSANSKLINEKFEQNEEIIKLNEKCAQQESQLQEKGAIAAPSCLASASVSEEYCCDMVKEIKGSLIDLMERDFQCCICGEMFVQATVTSCNHVFCSYCLQEWKKKQKRCPFCRAALSKEVRATIIDEFVNGLLKLISESMHTERMKIIDERQAALTAAVTPAAVRVPASRGRRNARRRNVIVDLA